MIIVLFHVLYLLGKFVYQNYGVKKQKAVENAMMNTEKQFVISERVYMMVDPESPQDNEDDKTLKFFPPAYVQRYVAVSDILNSSKYQGKLRKIVDFGCAELNFLVYLKNTSGVEEILCVDIDRSLLETHKNKAAPLISEYLHARTTPFVIEICEGSVTHNDKKLEKTDAVICIELIEHLYPDTLIDFPYNIFGFIKPKLVVITTPNADFNVLFTNFSGFRHPDHKFEWTRQQFQDWAENIVLRFPDYVVNFHGICKGPVGTEHLGSCSQMAVFHRSYEKDSCNLSIEGLFKTVVVHEYPFRVDNRSDEQKILDEAAYYIRHLSFQDSSMEEEVPLKKLWEMLTSFHISVDGLKTILEEAGWSVIDREFGPVILVPPRSTYSDYSTVEEPLWSNYFSTDEDGWNREPGPPINSTGVLGEHLSLESWDNENWDEEPSIVIPQNNFIIENNTYLFDEENVLYNVSDKMKNFEISEKYTETNSEENLVAKPDHMSIDDSNDLFDRNNLSDKNESMALSDSSFSMNLEDAKNSSLVLIRPLCAQDNTVSNTAQKLNRMLDFQKYMTTSHTSTSPEPYLLQTVKMDQHLMDDSMCNQSMSGYWMLSNSLEQSDLLKDTILHANDREDKKLSPKNDLNDSNSLCCICLNTSYRESEDSDSKIVNSDTGVSGTRSSMDGMQSVRPTDNVSKESQLQLQLNSSASFINNAPIDNLPQFTSSPKIDKKVNTTDKKRRPLDHDGQKNGSNLSNTLKKLQLTRPSSNNSLESSNETSSQTDTDVNVHIASIVSYSAIKKRYCEEKNPIHQEDTKALESGNDVVNCSDDNTLINRDVSTLASTLNDGSQTSKQLLLTDSLGKDKSAIFTTIGKNKIAAINPNNMQSINCDTRIQSADQLIVQPEINSEFIREENDRKTETKCESQKNIREIVDSTEISCNYAKDVNNLKSTLLVSSADDKDARSVQSTSVLKSEEQALCRVENRESKCKDASPNSIEVVESIEAKPSSPETVETPPNSWSPEVMDSGYPNSASAQDMTPEYDLSSIAQDHISDSEPPSIAEAPKLDVLEMVEVENGDLANNNRDGEGNNMMAVELNDLEDLQPLIDVLENDLENENDIYALENDFPIWLLRILDMGNPIDVEMQIRVHREQRFPDGVPEADARYVNIEHDEGFDSSSEEGDIDLENNETEDEDNSDVNENAVVGSENASQSDSGSDRWATGDT